MSLHKDYSPEPSYLWIIKLSLLSLRLRAFCVTKVSVFCNETDQTPASAPQPAFFPVEISRPSRTETDKLEGQEIVQVRIFSNDGACVLCCIIASNLSFVCEDTPLFTTQYTHHTSDARKLDAACWPRLSNHYKTILTNYLHIPLMVLLLLL